MTNVNMETVEQWWGQTHPGQQVSEAMALQAYEAAHGQANAGAQPYGTGSANTVPGRTTPGGTDGLTGGAGTTGPSTGGSMTYDQNGNPVTGRDALAIIEQELASWGFGQDAMDWAQQMIQSNNSVDQIVYSLRQQSFYVNSIFGQVAKARSNAGLPAMSEAQILAYQDYATGVAQQAGLPEGFINTPELVQLMGHDVSTSELDARITQGYQAALKSDPATMKMLNDYYGVTPGNMAAYYLDPQRALPLLQQQFLAAQAGGAAINSGFGTLQQSQAEALAALGTTQGQAEQGFTKLAQQQQLMTGLIGTDEKDISQATQLAAEFGAPNGTQGQGQAQQEIAQRAQEREAVFAGNYHFAETQNRGITGLGPVFRNG